VRGQSVLIDMHKKCGDIESSVSIDDGVRQRMLQCCNSLITFFLHCDIIEALVVLIGLMVDEGIALEEVTSCAITSGFEFDIAVSCSLTDA
ncbi:hypothetical protein CFOL_v3_04543, partial [Cephalotus follicularis]